MDKIKKVLDCSMEKRTLWKSMEKRRATMMSYYDETIER